MELWGQIISIVAMVAIILSFQCKSNKKLAFCLWNRGSAFCYKLFYVGTAQHRII